MKNTILMINALLGGYLGYVYKWLDKPKKFLLLFIILDFISGVIVALYFKNSNKTCSGSYSSNAGFKGLCKKCMIILLVVVAMCFDNMLNTNYVANTVCFGFITNECFSILENGKAMNIRYPKILDNCLDIVNKKSKNN